MSLVTIALLAQQSIAARADETSPQPDQILDNSLRGAMPEPAKLRGPLPPNKQGMPTPPAIQGKETPSAKAAAKKLDDIVEETIKSMGAMFVDPEQVVVKPPLLTALITVEEKLSPYSLEAAGSRGVTLRDVVNAVTGQNLDIKIAKTDTDIRRWEMISSVGNFLPTIANEMTYQGITGSYASPAGAALAINNYYLTTPSSFLQYLYKGGFIIHKYLEEKHRFKASKHTLVMVSNDCLMDTAKAYYKLALNEVLLQIRIKSVETAETLLLVNKDLYANGVNTMLEVLQAKTQLSRDRQDLIKQQIERRQSAIKLSTIINENAGTDLTLGNPQVLKTRLIDKSLSIKELLEIAVANRPELRRYEELRLAALDEIKVVKSALLPHVAVSGSDLGAFTRITNRNPLSSQQYPLSSSGGASAGAVSGASGLPVLSGGSGALHSTGRVLFTLGLDVKWELGGMGLTEGAKVQSARSNAHRRQLEFLRELNKVYEEVRDSYLSSITAENLIKETTDMVNSSKEQLRIAKDRLENGVGTNLDVISAERDYTSALIDKANAIIQFNTAQVELLRNLGKISTGTLVSSVPLRQ